MKHNYSHPRHRDVPAAEGGERMGKVAPLAGRHSRVGRYTHPAFPRHSHIHVQHTMPESLFHICGAG